MSSTAASAAFAAFKGTTQPVPTKSSKRKPQLHIKLDSNGSRAANDGRPNGQNAPKSKNTPAVLVPLESPVFNIRGVKDDQVSVTSDQEYFYNNSGNHSISSHDVANVESSSRSKISVNTRPQDMLKLVRDSINLKLKIGFGKDSALKSQSALNDFRNCLEQRRQLGKRNASPSAAVHVPMINSTREDLARLASASASNDNIIERLETPYRSGETDSMSSFGSFESESRDQLFVPPVRPRTAVDAGSDEDLPRKTSTTSQNVSPIQVPPSPNALARSHPVANEVPILSILSGYMSSGLDLPDIPEHKSLGRKPPPDLIQVINKDRKESISDLSMSSDVEDSSGRPGLILGGDLRKLNLSSDDSGPKFSNDRLGQDPQPNNYPLISRKVVPTEADTDESEQAHVPNVTITQAQPFKLKTTLRKMSKKQEKKTMFNEDKPWKNHSDLDIVSEQQRKRYEGLWVSNKGLYINRTVTRLVGVNYDKESKAQKPEDKRELSEKEVSEWAAKLSSRAKYHDTVDENDTRELHGLDEAESQELIHGIVVKRIWKRSRLLNDVLASIWDLVDYRRDGTLNKAEFLVGMWLVDQCLYGRKLPKAVSNTVWNSLGSLGVNVVLKKKRR